MLQHDNVFVHKVGLGRFDLIRFGWENSVKHAAPCSDHAISEKGYLTQEDPDKHPSY